MASDQPIIDIPNKHAPSCGRPPNINFDDYARVSYFENAHGEQLLFLYSEEHNDVTLFQGDSGWDEYHQIGLEALPNPTEGVYMLTESVLTQNERLWLEACLHALRHYMD